jgi:colanic acid biosynthesis glycosyl transferase WcaI
MKVLIYGINFTPELTGIGKYSGEMAEWLADQGHDVRVITAPPYYPEWSINEKYVNFYSCSTSKNMTVIRCPLYVPSKPTALKRLLHLASFSITSFLPVIGSVFWKPDLVIQVVPTLFCSVQTLISSKLVGAKSVVHIQDYEVDAMFDLSIAKTGLFKEIAYWLEKRILNSFQVVSTISKGMINRASQKGIEDKKLLFFPNWAEVDRFEHQNKDKKFLSDLGINPEKKIVLYSGNMGEKQGLESVVYAADLMRSKNDLQFIMVGEGIVKANIEKLAVELNLQNIYFFPLLPYSMLPKLLASADCHLVIQKKGAADAVLPSKLTNILAVGGNAVITASPSTTLGILCGDFPKIAVLVEPESVESLIAGIDRALSMPIPNQIAQKYAKDFLDKDMILSRFIKEVRQISDDFKS